MIDLGFVRKDGPEAMYPTMESKKPAEKQYDTINVPANILGNIKVGINDEIIIEIRGKIKSLSAPSPYQPNGSITIEARQGEAEIVGEEESEPNDKQTVLGKA